MRHSVESAEIVRYRVDVADISPCESNARVMGSEKHLLSGMDIGTVVISSFKIFKNHLGRLLRLCRGLFGI